MHIHDDKRKLCAHFESEDEAQAAIRLLRAVEATNTATWKDAITIARNHAKRSAESIVRIRETCGEGTADEEAESVAQQMAENIARALEAKSKKQC